MAANNRLDPRHKNRLSPKANGPKNPLSSIDKDDVKKQAMLAAFKGRH